jgi:DNA mismatch repair protein MLH1
MEVLFRRRDMIAEYFSLGITKEGILMSIPLLLRNYTPNYGKLPLFIRRLGRNVCSPISAPFLSRLLMLLYR